MNWLDPRRYSLPALVSVALHILVAVIFIVQWPTEHRMPEPVPQHVVANVVQVESAAEKQRKIKEEKDRKRKEQQLKRDQEKKKQQEKDRLEKEKQKKLAEQKKREADKALKEKQIADKKAQELAAKDKAAKDKAAKERDALEQSLLEQLAREQAAADEVAQQEAKKQAELAASMQANAVEAIRAKVESVWRYPPAVKPNMETEVHITLVPTGEVINVKILKGSGNAALDRSVEQAIYKASPLPVPKDPRVFEKSFRNLVMKFRPENATW
ncbi:TonB family protein [Thalassolituus sp. LLYu03]|uniref:cell envelope integrity protein TolA n=1 Tax=Thalassolituus sp. LLYu03 TaxID=3421656 RepID=UPI003D2DD23D